MSDMDIENFDEAEGGEDLQTEDEENNSSQMNSSGAVKKTERRKKKPKQEEIWSTEDTHLLIHSVEVHPSIWNFACEEYRLLNKREQAWDAIRELFRSNHSTGGCKIKWCNLKISYNKVKNKILKSKSGQGAKSNLPHWEFWSDMQFVVSNESANNTITESNLDFQTFDESANAASVAATGTGVAVRKRKPQTTPLVDKTMKRAMDVLNSEEDDEWQILGNYLASQLRRIYAENLRIANRIHRSVSKSILEGLEELDALSPQWSSMDLETTPISFLVDDASQGVQVLNVQNFVVENTTQPNPDSDGCNTSSDMIQVQPNEKGTPNRRSSKRNTRAAK